jgi:hypothetical protein
VCKRSARGSLGAILWLVGGEVGSPMRKKNAPLSRRIAVGSLLALSLG